MTPDIRIKICGLRDAAGIAATAQAGAAYIGLNFYPGSPRSVTFDQAATLSAAVPAGLAKVGLVVDMHDAMLDDLIRTVPLDMIQLHGSETPDRVAAIRARYGLPLIKAVGIANTDDLPKLDIFAAVADQLLVDTKPPRDAKLPGGNGAAFDWTLIAGRRWLVPWLLAGGLTADNVAQAISVTGALQVDVSSAVESAAGVKDPAKIAAFCAAARGD